MSPIDRFISIADSSLRALSGAQRATRPMPAASGASTATPPNAPPLDAPQRRLSGALMRVNHVGEVCAQALYTAQAASTRNPALRSQFERAAIEESDHLAWTEQRLRELGAHRSRLNPLWYAGAFGIGLLAGRARDAVSLGFVMETERQVEQHLESHLDRLPAADQASRALVRQMKDDEARHAASALRAGGVQLPLPVRWAMRAAARLMTATAHYI